MKLIKLTTLTVAVMLTVACSESKYSKMPESDLREKQRHCDSVAKKSTVFATGCENIRKEIERRKEERRSASK